MFRHMFQAMRYHRFYFRDPSYLPAGKVLEMVTIDAARALGLEKELGSLETGKKADVILIDMFKPHLMPFNMPVYRVAYFANGNDVDTVIVNGQVLMEGRRVLTVNEVDVLELAAERDRGGFGSGESSPSDGASGEILGRQQGIPVTSLTFRSVLRRSVPSSKISEFVSTYALTSRK